MDNLWFLYPDLYQSMKSLKSWIVHSSTCFPPFLLAAAQNRGCVVLLQNRAFRCVKWWYIWPKKSHENHVNVFEVKFYAFFMFGHKVFASSNSHGKLIQHSIKWGLSGRFKTYRLMYFRVLLVTFKTSTIQIKYDPNFMIFFINYPKI